MARIARLNVTSVVSAVRIAEYKPTRFEVAVNDSVATSRLLSPVISTYLSITSSYTTAHRSSLRFSFESSLTLKRTQQEAAARHERRLEALR